jgi:hypothetical protein
MVNDLMSLIFILDYSVHRKPTDIDLYLHAKSHHYPSQKYKVLATFINRAKTIRNTECRSNEIQHLRKGTMPQPSTEP